MHPPSAWFVAKVRLKIKSYRCFPIQAHSSPHAPYAEVARGRHTWEIIILIRSLSKIGPSKLCAWLTHNSMQYEACFWNNGHRILTTYLCFPWFAPTFSTCAEILFMGPGNSPIAGDVYILYPKENVASLWSFPKFIRHKSVGIWTCHRVKDWRAVGNACVTITSRIVGLVLGPGLYDTQPRTGSGVFEWWRILRRSAPTTKIAHNIWLPTLIWNANLLPWSTVWGVLRHESKPTLWKALHVKCMYRK